MLWDVRPGAAHLQARGLKLDTGIVGLPVVPNAREVLKEKIYKVLGDISEQIPEDAEYRKAIEATYKFRYGVLRYRGLLARNPAGDFTIAFSRKPGLVPTLLIKINGQLYDQILNASKYDRTCSYMFCPG